MSDTLKIPDGWQLVPKLPTEKMLHVTWNAVEEGPGWNPTFSELSLIYSAMLSAAPKPEAQE